jgi:hypothetical protein
MRPGDLVMLREFYNSPSSYPDEFVVGSLDMNSPGFPVPVGTVAVIVKIVESEDRRDGLTFHVMVPDGRIGWAYLEDCEVVNEASL